MKTKGFNWIVIILLINLGIICGVFISFLLLKYPKVGFDYVLVMSSLFDYALYFRINGFSIEWYTPSLGGGLPSYPDPGSANFSLFSLLTMFLNPLLSTVITIILLVGIGLFASYYFFSRILGLDKTSSILGAVFFSANGFMIQRIGIGHVGFFSYPLLAVILILLIYPKIPRLVAIALFALAVAVILYMGGYVVIIIFGFSIPLILPLIYIVKPEVFDWKRILLVISGGGCLSILLTASKLSAVYSFMRFFPRLISDQYIASPFLAPLGIILQLMGTMSLIPLRVIAGLDLKSLPQNVAGITGMSWGFWEFDMALSPVVFCIIILGIYNLFRHPVRLPCIFIKDRRWCAWLALALFTWLTTEYILARGGVYLYLHRLPILSSLHVNYRLTAAFLFPLALVAAIFYDRWVSRRKQFKLKIFVVVNLLTVLPLAIYLTPAGDFIVRSFDITDLLRAHQSMLAGDNFEVNRIGKDEDNMQALINRASNLSLYDPIFGYGLEYFHPQIKPGYVWEISNGYYNMTNPTGFVFPDVNNTHPFERIRVEERDKMEDFVARRQSDWKLPVYQQVSDQVSLILIVLALLVVVAYFAKIWLGKFFYKSQI